MPPDLAPGIFALVQRLAKLCQKRQISRYAQIGVLCALLNNGIVIALDLIGFAYPVGFAIAFVLVTTLAYVLHSIHTFRVSLSLPALTRFFTGNLGGLAVSVGLMVLFCSGLGMPTWMAMPIVTGLTFVWNLTLAQWALLKPELVD
jgi:putative flippase GtrA